MRLDNQRFLRASDVDGGRDDQFYWFDEKAGEIVEAPRGTLALKRRSPALEGVYKAKLKGGKTVKVTPAFALLKKMLDEQYTPEKAQELSGTNPELVRTIARKAAKKRTRMLMGWNSGKYYHGDPHGTLHDAGAGADRKLGQEGHGRPLVGRGHVRRPVDCAEQAGPGAGDHEQAILAGQDAMIRGAPEAEDPTMTPEIMGHEMAYRGAAMGGMVPPAFFWYYHCGYKEIWNKKTWGDVGMKRSFDEYFNEAIDKGWFTGTMQPAKTQEPRVIFEVGSNLLRRQRGGQNMLLKNLWPKLSCIITIDTRMNTTGMWSDYVLPAAHHYEKPNFCYSTPHIMHLTYSDRAVPPRGESKEEFEIAVELSKKIEQRAKARKFVEYTDAHGMPRRLDDLVSKITMNGYFDSSEKVLDEMVRDSVVMGNLPEGTTLDTFKEKGYVRFKDWGVSPMAIGQASDIKDDETHAPFRWHVEKKVVFPTLTRRAQFYIDHDWFLEAGEEFPVHKETPAQGGDYPFHLTSGHPRWSIHSMNMTNKIMLNTHRGHPFCYINTTDAEVRGVADDEVVELYNDMGSIKVALRVAPSVRPGQLIIYNGFEPLQFENWYDPANIEPGMVKWLAFAGRLRPPPLPRHSLATGAHRPGHPARCAEDQRSVGKGGSVSMRAKRIPDAKALLDPSAKAWGKIDREVVELGGMPIHLQTSRYVRTVWADKLVGKVRAVSVQAAHDGERLAIHLEWNDDTENKEFAERQFPDGAAVVFPSNGDASLVTLGAPDAKVNAWYWRADLEDGENLVAQGLGTDTQRRTRRSPGEASGMTAAGRSWSAAR